MIIIALAMSIVLSVFSTVVMSYISMATPIGPWIAPTLALMSIPIFSFFRSTRNDSPQDAGLVTSAGSIGGILATGMGFSLPTLYFVDPVLFNSWMAQPFYFCAMLSGLALSAGAFGLWIANVLEHKFIVEQQLAFPVGQLVYKMIAVETHIKKTWGLFTGFVGTMVFCVMQDGIAPLFRGFIPHHITVVPALTFNVVRIPALQFDIWPMVWAIGFVTGHVIAIPLAVGACTKIFLIDPLNVLYFGSLSHVEFILAFCSGMVISGTLMSFIGAPKMLWTAVKKMLNGGVSNFNFKNAAGLSKKDLIQLGCLLVILVSFLTYIGLSVLAQIYLLVFTAMCTYEIAEQAGKMGLATLGRFATFVMVPGMLLFNLSLMHLVFIAAFVEICGGVAADVLFGRKIAQCAGIQKSKMEMYQWLGLLVSGLTVGAIFWLLINHFQLGSPELFALKAQNRQLLLSARNFNVYVLVLGFIFGFMLKKVKVNPSLVLGGILMPLNISLGLVLGGLCTLFTSDRESWYPFWSGVFASNSVWMLIRALL